MPKKFTSKTQKTGELGEKIAERFLMKHGFSILDRNYTKKWGEIDIVAERQNKIYFIEVKSIVSFKIEESKDRKETKSQYRPEENMHPWKMKRMARVIQTYLLSKKIPDEKEWQVDLLVVYLDLENKRAKIKRISDLIL
jgi:putative endonuclease